MESPQNIPEDLKKNKAAKDSAAEKAQQEIETKISRGETFLVALGYISFLCILPLVLLRESKFAQFHGKQALVLAIFIYFFDILQIFPATLAFLYTIVKTVVVVYSIYMSFNGKYFRIPFIHSLSERFTIDIKPQA